MKKNLNIKIVKKNSNLIVLSLLCLLAACSSNTQTQEIHEQDISGKTKLAPIGEFEEFNVVEDWNNNPFDWFKGQGLLLAVGTPEHNNAMTEIFDAGVHHMYIGNIVKALKRKTVQE